MALSLDGTTGITSDGGTPVIENLDTTATGIAVTGELTTTGNVGLGVTPSGWGGMRAMDIGDGSFAISADGAGAGDGSLTWNGYYNGTNWLYKYTGGGASRFRLNETGAAWYTAPTGTAGNGISFTQAMTLNASGNLGVGTTSPSYRLSVVGTAGGNLFIDVAGQNVYDGTTHIFRSNSGTAERARIDSSGNLLVGTTSQYGSAKLSVNGAIANGTGWYTRAGSSGALGPNLFNINWTGSAALWIDSTNIGNIQVSSDYRIKKNVATQTAPAIERVMQLRPVTYELTDYGDLFKADGVLREGFIAHEVQEVIPSGAEGEKDEEGRIQNLRTDAILSVAIKAIQEQQAIIEALTARVSALEATNV